MGVAHIDGFCIFVAGTVNEDVVRALIVKIKTGYAYAKVTKIITPSPFRQEPVCKVFSKCGGCQLMHIKYEKQLDIKRNIINNALQRIAKTSATVSEMIASPQEYRYRNKMIFPVGAVGDKSVCGFYRERSHDIIPLEDCFLGEKINADILRIFTEHINKYHISVYNEQTHTGIIRRIFTRTAHHTGEIMVVISVNADSLKKSDELVKKLCDITENIKSVILNVNKERTNFVLGSKNSLLYGQMHINDILCGIKYEISPNSFYQINPAQTERLYQKALDYADISKNDIVMDLYCGVGTISLCAAKKAKKVVGIEIVEQAIVNAKKNAFENNIDNADFYTGDACIVAPQLLKDGLKPNTVILDPPRKGSDEKTLQAIVEVTPEKIVYVSCNPATLARDLKFLESNGYCVSKLCGVDMFPQTCHVETVCLLTKNNI